MPTVGTDYYDVLREVVSWGQRTFPHSTLRTVLTHLEREIDEWKAAQNSGEELADCLMLIAHMRAHLDTLEMQMRLVALAKQIDLADEIRRKLEINKARTWGQPDSEGVIEHIRSSRTPKEVQDMMTPAPIDHVATSPFERPEWADPSPPPLPTSEPQP